MSSPRDLTAATTSGAAHLESWCVVSSWEVETRGEARTLTARKAEVSKGVNFILAVVV